MLIFRRAKTIRFLWILALLTTLLIIAIFAQEIYAVDTPEKGYKGGEVISKSDILFVIDNSGSMSQEQENLAKNLDKFINEIVSAQNDFHIGVITTDVNYIPLRECENSCSNGMDCITAQETTDALRQGTKYCTKKCTTDADCPAYKVTDGSVIPSVCEEIVGFEKGQKYCIPENNGRLRSCKPNQQTCQYYNGEHPKVLDSRVKANVGDNNFIGILRDNVKVGINGTGYEKGLMAIRMALDRDWKDPLTGKNLVDNENAGFLRPDAKLTIIVLTDEDDCSYIPYDPSFSEDSNNRCYPNPNTCHPDCQPPIAPYCLNGQSPVEAIADAEYIKAGEHYCMKECATASDCEEIPVPNQKCGKVLGFDQSKNYCYCDYKEATPNPESKYDRLIPTQEFITFLKNLKGDAGVNMAVITGARVYRDNESQMPTDVEECASANGIACGGRRYLEVAKGLDKYYLNSICKDDYGQTMVDIVNTLITTGGSSTEDAITIEDVTGADTQGDGSIPQVDGGAKPEKEDSGCSCNLIN